MSLTSEQQRAVDETTRYIRHEIDRGLSDDAIVKSLVANGWTQADALSAVQGVRRSAAGLNYMTPVQYQTQPTYRPDAKSETHAAGVRKIIFGCCWFFGGIFVTVATYSAASNGGGTYVVAWGAILFGAIDIIRGISML